MGFNTGVPDWKQRLAMELKRDRKKTMTLAALFVVAGVLGGRALIICTPSPVAAADVAIVPNAGVASPAAPKAVMSEAPACEAAEKKPVAMGERKITRDIFQAKLEFYPQEAPVAETRSETRPAEDAELLEAQSAPARAKGLKLESTVTSGVPTAIINGKMFRVGDWISNFQVVQIDGRSCVIQPQKGPRITLNMASE